MSLYDRATALPIKNTGSHDCPAFGILQITGATYESGKLYLQVSRPDTTYRWLYIVCGPKGCAVGKYGEGYYATEAPVWALWTSGDDTPAIDTVYGPQAEQFTLKHYCSGFHVMGSAETSPFRRVLVKQVVPYKIYGTLDGTLTYEGTQTVDVKGMKAANDLVSTGMTVTGYDGFLESGQSVANVNCSMFNLGGKAVVDQTRGCAS